MYHYTYRITHIEHKKHYYGVRTSKIHPKDDLGKKYFSSSTNKEFINDQKNNPHFYKYKIIRISNTRAEAMLLEIQLHSKFDVGINENFYNLCKATSTSFDTTGVKRPEHSEFMKGKCFHSPDFLKKCHLNFGDTSGKNNPMYGTSRVGEQNPFFGKTHSKETMEKRKKSNLEKYGVENVFQLDEVKKKIAASKKSKKIHI